MLSDEQETQQKHQEILLGSRRLNPALVLRSWRIFSPWEAYKGSLMNHKQGEKRREIIFMRIVIASLVTRLNLLESKKLICENCHSGAAGIRARNISVTNYILQRLIKPPIFPFPISAFSEAPKLVAWANQAIFPDSTTDAFYLFLVSSIWLLHQL